MPWFRYNQRSDFEDCFYKEDVWEIYATVPDIKKCLGVRLSENKRSLRLVKTEPVFPNETLTTIAE